MVKKDGKKRLETKDTSLVISKKQIEKENKILRNIFIFIGALFFLFLVSYIVIDSIRGFNYEGVDFEVIKEGDLIFYKTFLPVIHEGKTVPYNFYMRNDPRKLKDVSFEGEIVFLKNMVLNVTSENLFCDGDWNIAIANLVNLYDVIGTKTIADETAGCDPEGRYSFLEINEGNVTEVKQVGPSCFEISINNCEVLEATEKLMVEIFVKLNN